jgi:predicted HTH domain antitoxin
MRKKSCYPEPMQITVDLPEDIAQRPDPGREALEALAIEGYRSHSLTQLDVGRLLGISRIQTEDFLARHIDLYDYSTEELAAEADLLHRLQP